MTYDNLKRVNLIFFNCSNLKFDLSITLKDCLSLTFDLLSFFLVITTLYVKFLTIILILLIIKFGNNFFLKSDCSPLKIFLIYSRVKVILAVRRELLLVVKGTAE